MAGTGIWDLAGGHGLDLALGSQDGSRVNLDVALGACWGARGPPRVGSLSRCLMFLGRIPRGIRPFMGGFGVLFDAFVHDPPDGGCGFWRVLGWFWSILVHFSSFFMVFSLFLCCFSLFCWFVSFWRYSRGLSHSYLCLCLFRVFWFRFVSFSLFFSFLCVWARLPTIRVHFISGGKVSLILVVSFCALLVLLVVRAESLGDCKWRAARPSGTADLIVLYFISL